MSLYSVKQAGRGGSVQPWASTLTVGKALKDFYSSLGDVTLTGANSITTLLDGPEKVVRYGNLVIGDGTTATSLTASQRCKGITIICDSLTVKANATVNMTGKGARVLVNDDPFYPFDDFRIPNQVTISSDRIALAKCLDIIKAEGFAPWDRGTWTALVSGLFGFNLNVSQVGALALMLASGCGPGGIATYAQAVPMPGNTGTSGVNGGMGGGGSGSTWGDGGARSSAAGGSGSPYSGGSGSGGCRYSGSAGREIPLQSNYSGQGGNGGNYYFGSVVPWNAVSSLGGGGGAGNPGGTPGASYGTAGGNGCGGKLAIICPGTVTVQSGGKIEANGMPGGNDGYVGGGGSGGGHISIITSTPGQLVNNGTIQAAGGSTGYSAGSGGAGSVVTKTFADMGWA